MREMPSPTRLCTCPTVRRVFVTFLLLPRPWRGVLERSRACVLRTSRARYWSEAPPSDRAGNGLRGGVGVGAWAREGRVGPRARGWWWWWRRGAAVRVVVPKSARCHMYVQRLEGRQSTEGLGTGDSRSNLGTRVDERSRRRRHRQRGLRDITADENGRRLLRARIRIVRQGGRDGDRRCCHLRVRQQTVGVSLAPCSLVRRPGEFSRRGRWSGHNGYSGADAGSTGASCPLTAVRRADAVVACAWPPSRHPASCRSGSPRATRSTPVSDRPRDDRGFAGRRPGRNVLCVGLITLMPTAPSACRAHTHTPTPGRVSVPAQLREHAPVGRSGVHVRFGVVFAGGARCGRRLPLRQPVRTGVHCGEIGTQLLHRRPGQHRFHRRYDRRGVVPEADVQYCYRCSGKNAARGGAWNELGWVGWAREGGAWVEDDRGPEKKG